MKGKPAIRPKFFVNPCPCCGEAKITRKFRNKKGLIAKGKRGVYVGELSIMSYGIRCLRCGLTMECGPLTEPPVRPRREKTKLFNCLPYIRAAVRRWNRRPYNKTLILMESSSYQG